MTWLYALATVFGMLMGAANLPQAIKIFRRKSAKDIHPMTYIILVIGSLIWIAYGVEIRSVPVIVSNISGFIFLSMVMIGWLAYGRN
ncbi:MAG: SemiSWEET family transporter [Candidatus Paceibacterota bacterium]